MTDKEINEKFDKLFTALEEIRDTIPKGSSTSIGVIMEHTAGIEGQLKTLAQNPERYDGHNIRLLELNRFAEP